MEIRKSFQVLALSLTGLALLGAASAGLAQVPVDDEGYPIGDFENASPGSDQAAYGEAELGNEGIPLLSAAELEDLVGPVALYPDDLLAVVLPASTFPLQVVQAARFLEDLESNPDARPNPEWDDSIIALINYPEVVELLNEDLDWTWRLGEAVVAQQADVVMAVEGFRNRAYAAGNLRSDDRQHVSHDDGVIEITPVQEDIIYVPYYEPERVVVYQPRPVYYYYPRPCPVYYYPYPDSYAFNRGYFWGVTTAFTIGWRNDHLRVFHHSYRGHPYYGRRYWNRWWYRRPSINVYNTSYVRNRRNVNRYSTGDTWRPSRRTRVYDANGRITRSYSRSTGSRRSQSNLTASSSANRSTETWQRRVIEREAGYDRDRRRSYPSTGSRPRSSERDRNRNRDNRSGSVGTVPPDYKARSRVDREPERPRAIRPQPQTEVRRNTRTETRRNTRTETRRNTRNDGRAEPRPRRQSENRAPTRSSSGSSERRSESRQKENRQQKSADRRTQRSESRSSRRDEPRRRDR